MNSQYIDLDSPIEPRPAGCSIPLTSSQARIWNRSLEADGRRVSLRMCASAVRVVGPLSLDLLETSIEIVVRRHEALRTRIVSIGGSPYQQIESVPARLLSIVDLSDQLPNARHEVSRLAQEFIDAPIDLAVGPMFEAKVWRLSGDEHVLVLLIDHMVTDGMSNGIVTREVWECYRQGLLGRPIGTPRASVQFPDYAIWQAQTHPAWMEKHAEYWRQHLCSVRPTRVPVYRNLLDGKSAVEVSQNIPFGGELTDALRRAARRERTLLSVFVLAAYAVALSAWCRTEDLLVLFASHGRHRPALQNVVGYVAHTLHLRIEVKREQAFDELLAQMKREVAAAFEHRDFERVQDLLPHCATEVGFNWQSTHSKDGAQDYHVPLESADPLSRSFQFDPGAEAKTASTTKQLRLLPFHARSPGVKFSSVKFAPVIFDAPAGIHMIIGFDQRILAPNIAERFGQNLLKVSEEICRHPLPLVASLLEMIAWPEDGRQ